MLLSDIDGTILDMRHIILAVLNAYDRTHSSGYFDRLRLSDITVHENRLGDLLDGLNVPARAQDDILRWYLEQRWTSAAIREMHPPFRGAGCHPLFAFIDHEPANLKALAAADPNRETLLS